MILQHPVFLAELPVAEAAVPYYTLCCLIAFLECALGLLGRAAAERKRHMERGVGRNGKSGYGEGRVGGRGEVFACVDKAKGRWRGRGSEGEEVEEGGDGG